MMRIVVVGNSHAAAIRMGWDLVAAEFPEVSLTFLAAPRAVFETFAHDGKGRFGLVDPGGLTPNMRKVVESLSGAEGAALTVDPRAFDHVLIVGPEWGEFSLFAMLAHFGIDGVLDHPGAPRLSAPAFAAFCDDLVRQSLAVRMAGLLAGHRVAVMPRPRRSELGLGSDAAGEETVVPRLPAGLDPAGVERGFDLHADRLSAALGRLGATLVRQPAATVGTRHLSRAEYSVGRKVIERRGVTTETLDTVPMNADYGALCLRGWLAGLA
ncbi:MAG: hypothetical protein KF887_08525 [Paracoccaceae bacterium]|nr:MAG: hypothetical protein KF887_08525 [Paracoccaceae bacterium]